MAEQEIGGFAIGEDDEAVVSVAGVTASGSPGSLSRIESGGVTGAAASGLVGTLAGVVIAALIGVAGIGGVGTEGPSGAGTFSGVAGTGATGTQAAAGAGTVSGAVATGSAGDFLASSGLTGVAAIGSPGSFAITGRPSLVGVAGSASPGAFASPTISGGIAGAAGTGQAGSLVDVDAVPFSADAAGSVGDFAEPVAAAYPPGVAGTGFAGSFATLLPLTGLAATGASGAFAQIDAPGAVAAAGLGVAGNLGKVEGEGLGGLAATAAVGTLAHPLSVRVESVSASGSAGAFSNFGVAATVVVDGYITLGALADEGAIGEAAIGQDGDPQLARVPMVIRVIPQPPGVFAGVTLTPTSAATVTVALTAPDVATRPRRVRGQFIAS